MHRPHMERRRFVTVEISPGKSGDAPCNRICRVSQGLLAFGVLRLLTMNGQRSLRDLIAQCPLVVFQGSQFLPIRRIGNDAFIVVVFCNRCFQMLLSAENGYLLAFILIQ